MRASRMVVGRWNGSILKTFVLLRVTGMLPPIPAGEPLDSRIPYLVPTLMLHHPFFPAGQWFLIQNYTFRLTKKSHHTTKTHWNLGTLPQQFQGLIP